MINLDLPGRLKMVDGKADENFGAGCRRRILRGGVGASAPFSTNTPSKTLLFSDPFFKAVSPTNPGFYPKATSSIIMSTNPTATPTVLILVCSPACASGINSSTTT